MMQVETSWLELERKMTMMMVIAMRMMLGFFVDSVFGAVHLVVLGGGCSWACSCEEESEKQCLLHLDHHISYWILDIGYWLLTGE
jgi:hypothetical protein